MMVGLDESTPKKQGKKRKIQSSDGNILSRHPIKEGNGHPHKKWL